MRKLVLATAMVASAAYAQTVVPDAADPYVQAQSGMRFPTRVGSFERHQIIRYNADGSDTGVGYQLLRGGRKVAYVSVFVYPAPPVEANRTRDQTCAAAFDGIKRDITMREPDARLSGQSMIAAPAPDQPTTGLRATFSGGTAKFDGQQQRVTEQATLFCYVSDRWLVSYRSTSPEAEAPSAAIEAFVKALGWPQALPR